MPEATSVNNASSTTPTRRQPTWFIVAITLLVIGFISVVVMREHIRARWWAYQLTKTTDIKVQSYYLALLTQSGKAGFRPIIQLSHHDNPSFRSLAIFALKSQHDHRARGRIREMLGDEDRSVRDTAGVTIAFLAEQDKIYNILRDTATEFGEENVDRAVAATAALSRVRASESAFTLVYLASKSPIALIRAQAVESLASLLISPEPAGPVQEVYSGRETNQEAIDQVSAREFDLLLQHPLTDAMGTLVEALADHGEFRSSLALEREILMASAFTSTRGQSIALTTNDLDRRVRTVAEIAAAALSQLTGHQIMPIEKPPGDEYEGMKSQYRAWLLERRGLSEKPLPASQPKS